ncbi:hypothetical protein B6N60_04236 [Richelia sinica FACHB-800]|uniref:Uncharacterized protein n=1 Tax=Richelia sinica FACHB-800 TaxID=1357546 RepID=A0A975TB23_9NOST|nr:DUF3226 domain-containing protein [Richelia sinica]MBD2666396.1 hypothetical protein [Richelia sinica FACHB-800]QXE25521.1 hypothetical protein B6N60_04236 [Richelia sinica FACHB-800]
MTNILIVESKNDEIFINKLIELMNLNNVTIDQPIYIHEYERLSGLDKTKLTQALKSLSLNVPKKDIQKVGIIIDQDNYTKQERLDFVNECINDVFEKSSDINDVDNLIEVATKEDNIGLKLGCYFTNIDQTGELETVLKAIKTQPSPHADCLYTWRNCVHKSEIIISDKEFDKFWFSIYLRYDTCSHQESKQAGKKCSMSEFAYVLEHKSHILDFESSILDDLKNFLRLFAE